MMLLVHIVVMVAVLVISAALALAVPVVLRPVLCLAFALLRAKKPVE
jgi:hypothetical protein